MSESIELWRPVSGASSDGHLGMVWYDLPESVKTRARAELKESDPFVLFVVGERAGLVTFGRAALFSASPQEMVVEILRPAKGGGGVSIRADGHFVARWPYTQQTVPRITDAARFIANTLNCSIRTVDLGVDC